MLNYNRKNIEVKSLVKIYFYGQGTWTRMDAMDIMDTDGHVFMDRMDTYSR
jgi:hypothetical protein